MCQDRVIGVLTMLDEQPSDRVVLFSKFLAISGNPVAEDGAIVEEFYPIGAHDVVWKNGFVAL